MSETIGKLAEALAKAQAMMKPAAFDKVNPHFKSKYASLASVMDAVREPLSKNGIAMIQEVSSRDGGVACKTLLLHASGEQLSSELWLPAAQASTQAYGSAISYARRYSLSAMLGVVADEADDDGEAATEYHPKKSKPQPIKSQETPAVAAAMATPISDSVLSAMTDDKLSEKIHHATQWLSDNQKLDAKTRKVAEQKLAQFQQEAARRISSAVGMNAPLKYAHGGTGDMSGLGHEHD